jgi:hypothetical protein
MVNTCPATGGEGEKVISVAAAPVDAARRRDTRVKERTIEVFIYAKIAFGAEAANPAGS